MEHQQILSYSRNIIDRVNNLWENNKLIHLQERTPIFLNKNAWKIIIIKFYDDEKNEIKEYHVLNYNEYLYYRKLLYNDLGIGKKP
jgi:hypothetical protein